MIQRILENHTKIQRTSIILLFTVIISLGGWALIKVTATPDEINKKVKYVEEKFDSDANASPNNFHAGLVLTEYK